MALQPSGTAPMAERAGKALNRAIAEQIMGWLYWDGKGDWMPPRGQRRTTMFATWDRVALSVYERGSTDVTLHFSPSTDMSDAWSVVQRMQANGYELRLLARPTNVSDAPGGTSAMFYRHVAEALMESEVDRRLVVAQSAPLAVCRAALKAVAATVGEAAGRA